MAKSLELKNGMEKELEEKWINICQQAQTCKGVADTGNDIVPNWYDHDKFEEAKQYLLKNIMG